MPTNKKKSSGIFDLLSSEFATPNYGQKEFKRALKKLKKLGLVSNKVDPVTQEATRYMRRLVRNFADVLKGEAKVLSVPRAEAKQYKTTGHRTKGKRVVVPVEKGESVRRSKPENGVPTYTKIRKDETGRKRVTRKVVLFNEEQLHGHFASYVQSLRPLKKGEYYVIRFKGYQSGRFFTGPDAKAQLLHWIMLYVTEYDTDEDASEIFSFFEVVTIHNDLQRQVWEDEYREQRRQTVFDRRSAGRERHRAYQARKYAELSEYERKLRNTKSRSGKQRDANYQRQRREQLKQQDPAAYEKMLRENAARVKLSRAKRKGK